MGLLKYIKHIQHCPKTYVFYILIVIMLDGTHLMASVCSWACDCIFIWMHKTNNTVCTGVCVCVCVLGEEGVCIFSNRGCFSSTSRPLLFHLLHG